MLLETKEHGVIDHKKLYKIAQEEGIPFAELLKGSRFKLERPERPKSKLQDHPQFLHMEYNRLVADLKQPEERDSFAKDIKAINKYTTALFNWAFSVVAAFFAVFYFAHSFSDTAKILLGFAAAFAVGGAELYFFIRDAKI